MNGKQLFDRFGAKGCQPFLDLMKAENVHSKWENSALAAAVMALKDPRAVTEEGFGFKLLKYLPETPDDLVALRDWLEKTIAGATAKVAPPPTAPASPNKWSEWADALAPATVEPVAQAVDSTAWYWKPPWPILAFLVVILLFGVLIKTFVQGNTSSASITSVLPATMTIQPSNSSAPKSTPAAQGSPVAPPITRVAPTQPVSIRAAQTPLPTPSGPGIVISPITIPGCPAYQWSCNKGALAIDVAYIISQLQSCGRDASDAAVWNLIIKQGQVYKARQNACK